MNLMEVLQSQLSDDVLGQISQQIGAEKEQTATAANGIFATLLGGMATNATNTSGLASLASALDRDHDGSILDDLAGMVGNMSQTENQSAAKALNGAGILGHILGDRQEVAAQQISQNSGLNINQIMKLMPILAPIVMGVLGRAKNSNGGLDLGGLANILMGSVQNAQSSGYGDLIGSVLGGVLGGNQPQAQPQRGGGLFGQILGGLFGKK
ncbi:MAG: DUF937 domain-containing protein [Lewinellaceae bacterium]|nr:DUF937 domain-containing protein [Saprospiraceae bacterium]MCB9317177.1 DUF937 domain-containing protein [Lewinellaceae bacterium]MCB9331760.1 DUF937 domain-containing protein [Lewinellaceae bacterium]